MTSKTLRNLFIHSLSDVYSAEKQLTKALPKMARAATNANLKAVFESHLEETRGQILRIDQVVGVMRDQTDANQMRCNGRLR